MARIDFPTVLSDTISSTIDNGGEIYWFFRITPSGTPGPSNKHIVSGTIRTTSFTDTTILADRLLDISDLDIRGNPLQDPLAKVADVKIKIQNITAGIDFSDFLGRIVEVSIGAGTTMSLATSAVMFTGKIKEVKTIKDRVIFLARGRGELRDKEIGERNPDDVHEKFKGHIVPIAHGNWTDDQAFLPAIIDRPYRILPGLLFDNRKWKGQMDSIYFYDDQLRLGMRSQFDQGFIINSDNNKVFFAEDIGTTPNSLPSGQDHSTLAFSGTNPIEFLKSEDSTVPTPTIIKVDDELMIITEHEDNGALNPFLQIERGWAETDIKSHPSGSTIFQLNRDATRFLITIQHIFFPESFSGMESRRAGGVWIPVRPKLDLDTKLSNAFDDDDSNFFAFEATHNIGSGLGGPISDVKRLFTLVFPKFGATGAIKDLFIIAKCEITVNKTVNGSSLQMVGQILLSKDNIDIPTSNDSGNTSILRVFRIITGATTLGFNNIDDGDSEKEKIITKGKIVEFKITSSQTIGTNSDSEYKDNNSNKFRVVSERAGFICGVYPEGTDSPAVSSTITKFTGKGEATYTYVSIFVDYESDKDEGVSFDNVEDLSNTRLNMIFRFKRQDEDDGEITCKLNRIGLRIDFEISPVEHDLYSKTNAREHPGSYFNGSSGDLIEAPSIVIEDFCRNDVANMTAANDLEESFFDSFHTDRTAWKLATVIYTR